MLSLRRLVLSMIFALAASLVPAPQDTGVLEVNGRVKIDGKQERLKRKRFYLFRGGLDANKALVERIRTAEYTSRDCFYCKLNASAEFRAWLKVEDCESPFCREISGADSTKVPEFRAALEKGRSEAHTSELHSPYLHDALPIFFAVGSMQTRLSSRGSARPNTRREIVSIAS